MPRRLAQDRFGRGRSSPGFTLVEVLIVLAILGMLAAVCIPRLRLDDGTRLRTAMLVLRSDLRAARSAATRGGEAQALSATEGGYAVRPMGVDRTLPTGFGLAIQAPDPGSASGAREIRFYPEGGSNGGNLIIRNGDLSASIKVRNYDGGLIHDAE